MKKADFRINRRRLASLCRRLDLKLVVLFGSQARGRTGPLSDVDIAVLSDRKEIDLAYRGEVGSALSCMIPAGKVDVLFLNGADPFIQFSVSYEGRCLYQRERNGFSKFQLYALKMREDAEKLLDWYREYNRRSLEALGA